MNNSYQTLGGQTPLTLDQIIEQVVKPRWDRAT